MPDTTLTEETGRSVVLIRAAPDGRLAAALGAFAGRAGQDGQGRLIVRPGPGEWLLIGGDGPAGDTVAEAEARAAGEFATAVDLTHAVTRLRLTGSDVAAVLSRLCALDPAMIINAGRPNGAMSIHDHGVVEGDAAAARTLVAGVITTVIRDDVDGVPSYVLQCDRSYGRYLAAAITDTIT